MAKKSIQDFQEAGKEAVKRLQDSLDKKAKGDVLGIVALRLIGALDAKKKDKEDWPTRIKAGDRIIAVFGAKEPEKRQLEGADGGPVVVEIVQHGSTAENTDTK